MERRDVEAFLKRDWGLVAASKEDYWADRKRRLGPGEGLRIGDELRRQVLAVRPEYPTAEDRAEDIACHARVAEMLRRASGQRRS